MADENYCCMEDALEASIFAIATYPEDIPDVANYLGKIIEERAKVCPQNKLSILACTNKNHYIDDVCSCFRQALQTEEAEPGSIQMRLFVIVSCAGQPMPSQAMHFLWYLPCA